MEKTLTLFFEPPEPLPPPHLGDADVDGNAVASPTTELSSGGSTPLWVSYVLTQTGTEPEQGRVRSDSLGEMLQLADITNTLVAVPGEWVTMHQMTIPKGSRRYLDKTLPYLLEDNLASNIENLHFAPGKPDAEGKLHCAVIDRHCLENCLDTLRGASIIPKWLVPDYLTLPVNQDHNGFSIQHHRERWLIQFADGTGVTLAQSAIPSLMQLQHEESEKEGKEKEEIIGATPDKTAAIEGDITPRENNLTRALQFIANRTPRNSAEEINEAGEDKEKEQIAPWQLSSVMSQVQDRLQPTNTTQPLINMLQGEFATSSQQPNPLLSKPVLIAAGVMLCILLSYFVAAGWYFNRQAMALEAQTKAMYQQLFPQEKRIINVKKQLEAKLRKPGSTNSSGDFFTLLSGFSTALNSVPPANKPTTQVRHIRFENSNGYLQADLQTKAMGDANGIQKALKDQGVEAEVLSANSNDAGVLARLRLSVGEQPKTNRPQPPKVQ